MAAAVSITFVVQVCCFQLLRKVSLLNMFLIAVCKKSWQKMIFRKEIF